MLSFNSGRGHYVGRCWAVGSQGPSYKVEREAGEMARTRVERLRDLVEVIEHLPASPERDRLLSEARARAVDVDTGVTPRAMLPLREPAPVPAPPRPPRPERVGSIVPMLRPLPPGAVAFTRPAVTVSRSAHVEESLAGG
jgi:hypothetical protein